MRFYWPPDVYMIQPSFNSFNNLKLLHSSIAILLLINGLFVEATIPKTTSDSLQKDPLGIVLHIESLVKKGQLLQARTLLSANEHKNRGHSIEGNQSSYLRGLLHFYEGKYQLAVPFLKAAIHRPPLDQAQKRWNLRPLGIINHAFYYQSQLDSSINYSHQYLKTLEYFKAQNPQEWNDLWKKGVYNTGHLYVERGNYQAALEQYKLWTEVASEGAEKSLALTYYGRNLIEIGAVHQGLGILKEAEKSLKNTHSPFPLQYALQAEAYLKINQLDQADSSLGQLFRLLSHQSQNTWIMATAEFTKGCILYKRKAYDKSIDFFRRAIKKLEQHDPNSQMIILGYTQWYNSLIETRQFNAAEELSNALSSNPRHKSSIHWLRYELATAKRAMYIDRQAEAQEILRDILERNTFELEKGIVRYIDPWLQAQAHMNLITLNQKPDTRATDNTFRQYLKADEAIGDLRMTYLEYADQIGLSDTLHGMYQQAVDYGFQLYANDPDQNLMIDLAWLMERSKSISLYQHLDLKERQSKSAQNSNVNHELNYYYRQLFKEKGQQALLKDTLLKLEDARYQYAHEDRFRYSASRPDLKKLFTKMESDELLISFYFGKQYLYRLVANQKGQTIQSLGQVAEAEKAIQNFNRQLSKRDFSREGVFDYQKAAHDLYQLLFDGIPQKQLKWHLTIIPDEMLFQVPFELLTTQPSSESYSTLPYLLRRHVIKYGHSLSILSHFHDLARTPLNGVMAIAPNKFETAQLTSGSELVRTRNFGPLTHNQAEAEQVTNLIGGIVLKNEEATESAFKSQFKPNAILHLATHAYNDPKEPDNSYIFFQKTEQDTLNDGKLYAWEVYESELLSPMVVLSACDTGLGKLYGGEGPQSLASSFFRAGARSVLMSLWKANDLTTAELMQLFYKHLSSGQSKDSSLRQAKLDFLENCSEIHSHPTFWGGFVVTGDTSPIGQNSNRYWWVLLLLPTVVLLWLFKNKKSYTS